MTQSNRPDSIIAALVQVLVPLTIILFYLAYLYARYHVWELMRSWMWIGESVMLRTRRRNIDYLSPCKSGGVHLSSDERLDSVVAWGASMLLGPHVVSVCLSIPGQASIKVPYRLQPTEYGVELVFLEPLAKSLGLVVELKNRWTRRINVVDIVWSEPTPEPDRWAFLRKC